MRPLSGRGSALVSAFSIGLATAASLVLPFRGFADQLVLLGAAMSLAWSGVSVAAGHRRVSQRAGFSPGEDAAIWAAVCMGTVAAILLAVNLVERFAVAVPAIVNAAPQSSAAPMLLVRSAIIACALLAASCALQILGRGAAWAVAALFGVCLIGAACLSTVAPVVTTEPSGGTARGAFSLVIVAVPAAVLCTFIIAQGLIGTVRAARRFAEDPMRVASATDWPGFSSLCAVVGLFLVIGVCYHFAMGFDVAGIGRRWVAFSVMCISTGSGVALLWLLRRGWSANIADVGMALVCLGLCGLAVLFVPGQPAALSRRYPLLLNAMLIGLALGSWLWGWLSRVWQQQLHDGVAWTVAGRMIGPARRAALFAALTGLIAACFMTAWPRLTVASDLDDSLGRIAAGVAGHLLLLWAVLWSARKLRRAGFSALGVLVVASMISFIYVRTTPLTTAAF